MDNPTNAFRAGSYVLCVSTLLPEAVNRVEQNDLAPIASLVVVIVFLWLDACARTMTSKSLDVKIKTESFSKAWRAISIVGLEIIGAVFFTFWARGWVFSSPVPPAASKALAVWVLLTLIHNLLHIDIATGVTVREYLSLAPTRSVLEFDGVQSRVWVTQLTRWYDKATDDLRAAWDQFKQHSSPPSAGQLAGASVRRSALVATRALRPAAIRLLTQYCALHIVYFNAVFACALFLSAMLEIDPFLVARMSVMELVLVGAVPALAAGTFFFVTVRDLRDWEMKAQTATPNQSAVKGGQFVANLFLIASFLVIVSLLVARGLPVFLLVEQFIVTGTILIVTIVAARRSAHDVAG